MWSVGSILNASLASNVTSGVQFLRYDFSYQITTNFNNSGTVAGFAFYDTTGSRIAGAALQFDALSNTNPVYKVKDLAKLTNSTGTISIIARVDLATQQMALWYSLTGDISGFSEGSPMTNLTVNLPSFNALRFHATGDFRPSGSTDFVDTALLRTADSWADIILPDRTFPVLSVSATDALGGGMVIGQTNVISVVITNSGGLATTTRSVLTGPTASFSIISNNAPVSLGSNQSVTNTFQIVALADGQYSFTVQALSDRANSSTITHKINVGRKISLSGYSIAEISGGLISGYYEPGETIQISIVNTNNGGLTVSNITSSMSANPALFSISPSSAFYPQMVVGDSTTTVYNVVISPATPHGSYGFVVTNRTAIGDVWPESFILPVTFQGIPTVGTNLVINVYPGTTTNATIPFSNSGNAPLTYQILDDGTFLVYNYSLTTEQKDLVPFNRMYDDPDPLTSFTNWSGDSTAVMGIGFGFPFYGGIYTNFTVSRYGAIVFGGDSVSNNPTGWLPAASPNNKAFAAPFWGTNAVAVSSIRYKKENDRLVVAWGNGNDPSKEVQAWLYKDGRIRYLYETGERDYSWVAIGLQNKDVAYKNVEYIPTPGISLLLTPNSWVSYSPTSGVLSALGGTSLVFNVDAQDPRIPSSVHSANLLMKWGNGTTSKVSVAINVYSLKLEVRNAYTNILIPTSLIPDGNYATSNRFWFAGKAGFITATNALVISNNSNVGINYVINYPTAPSTYYRWEQTNHQDILVQDLDQNEFPWIGGVNAGYSALIPLGFTFRFFTNDYTHVSIGVDGAICLGESRPMNNVILGANISDPVANSVTNNLSSTNAPDHFIAPFWSDLVCGNDARVYFMRDDEATKFVVTWENMHHYYNGASNLTFRAIINRDGTIQFEYERLAGSNYWPYVSMGLRDRFSYDSPVLISLSNETTTVITTNYVLAVTTNKYDVGVVTNIVSTNLVRQYRNVIEKQFVNLAPDVDTNRVIVTASPLTGYLPVAGSQLITVYGDARQLVPAATQTNVVTYDTLLSISYAPGLVRTLGASFVVTNSENQNYPFAAADQDGDGRSDNAELLFGSDGVVNVIQNPDRTRTILWDSPIVPSLTRKYTVWCSTNLMAGWTAIGSVTNLTQFTDRDHADVPVIYYKVTVE
jgi:hypothetical protein